VKLLLDHGADINSQSAVEPGTALTAASNHGHEKVVKLLLENGADIELRLTRENGTAFMAACRNGHQNVAKLLLDNGASVTSPWDGDSEAYYRSALEEARQSGRRDIEKLLLKHRPIWN
jgi:ankyrin repeat protein